MSDRGSFVTEYIYCSECLEAVKSVLLSDHKYLCSRQLPTWTDYPFEKALPILAGKIGGLYPGEELDDFRNEFIPALEKLICHTVRIAVLAEEGSEIFTIEPKLEKRK